MEIEWAQSRYRRRRVTRMEEELGGVWRSMDDEVSREVVGESQRLESSKTEVAARR